MSRNLDTGGNSILVVDDDPRVLRSVRRTLRSAGFENVLTLDDSRQVRALSQEHPLALVLLDLAMPHVGGEQILAELRKENPEIPVIVVTGQDEVGTAVRCMKLGAADYLLKPVAGEHLVATVEKCLENSALKYECDHLRQGFFGGGLQRPEAFAGIVTQDPAMQRVFAYLEAIARGRQPVLIAGETGTGKELIARALHELGDSGGPFVAVNVAGLDDAVFSDTLFGHTSGAFTGASSARPGMVERAGSGTLFLDEIGDLSAASQVKLLRLLQEREYYPLGSDQPRRLRARVLAATHCPTSALRQDLYYRLRSYRVELPPLRDRPGDIGHLLEHFLAAAAADLGRPKPAVTEDLLFHLRRYHFPGNVRELRSMAFDALARQQEANLSAEPFLELMEEPSGNQGRIQEGGPRRVLSRQEWRQLERENLLEALLQSGWRISGKGGAAELLGMAPSTLESKMKAHEIRRPETDL